MSFIQPVPVPQDLDAPLCKRLSHPKLPPSIQSNM
jgi:hypothetical protein